jgi:hypothetical protein
MIIHNFNRYECGVHHNVVKGVKIYFLHNFGLFPKAYADQGSEDRFLFYLKLIIYLYF